MEPKKRMFITTQPAITNLNCTHLERAKALNTTLTTAIKRNKRAATQSIILSSNVSTTRAAPPIIISASAKPASPCGVAKSQESAADILGHTEDFSSVLSQPKSVLNTQQTVESGSTASMTTATTTMFGSTTVVLVVTETAQAMPLPTTVAGVVETTVTVPAFASETTSFVDDNTTTSSREAESTSTADETGDAGMSSTLSIATTETASLSTASLLLSTSEQTSTTSSSLVTSKTQSALDRSSITSSQPTTTAAIEASSTATGLAKSTGPGLQPWAIAVIAAVPAAILIIAGICLFLRWRHRRQTQNGSARAGLPIHLQPIPHNPYRVEPTLPSVDDRGPNYPYIGARRAPILPDCGPEHAYAMTAKSLSATNSNASSTRPRNISPLPAALNSHPAARRTLHPDNSASQISRPTSPIRPSVVTSPPMPAGPELSVLKEYNNPYNVGVHELDSGDKVSRMDYGSSQDARRRSAVIALSKVFPSGVPRESCFATDTVRSDDPFKRGGR